MNTANNPDEVDIERELAENREKMIRQIIREGIWEGMIDLYSNDELEAILNFGSPNAYHQQEYYDGPTFIEGDGDSGSLSTAVMPSQDSQNFRDVRLSAQLGGYRAKRRMQFVTSGRSRVENKKKTILKLIDGTVLRSLKKYDRILDHIRHNDLDAFASFIIDLPKQVQSSTINRYLAALIDMRGKTLGVPVVTERLYSEMSIKKAGMATIKNELKNSSLVSHSEIGIYSVTNADIMQILEQFKIYNIISNLEFKYVKLRLITLLKVYRELTKFRRDGHLQCAVICVRLISPWHSAGSILDRFADMQDVYVDAKKYRNNIRRFTNKLRDSRYIRDVNVIKNNFKDFKSFAELLDEFDRRLYFEKEYSITEMIERYNKDTNTHQLLVEDRRIIGDLYIKALHFRENTEELPENQFELISFLKLNSHTQSKKIITNMGYYSHPLLFILSYYCVRGASIESSKDYPQKLRSRLEVKYGGVYTDFLVGIPDKNDLNSYTVHLNAADSIHGEKNKDMISWIYEEGDRDQIIAKHSSARQFSNERLDTILIIRSRENDALAMELTGMRGQSYTLLIDDGTTTMREARVMCDTNNIVLFSLSSLSDVDCVWDGIEVRELEPRIMTRITLLMDTFQKAHTRLTQWGYLVSGTFESIFDRKVIVRVPVPTYQSITETADFQTAMHNIPYIRSTKPLFAMNIVDDIFQLPQLPRGSIVLYLGISMNKTEKMEVEVLIDEMYTYGMTILIHEI